MVEKQRVRDKVSEKLTDPSKAAHEIVEVLEDGDAIRNDGVRLTAANKNPWYVLATIYGEQEIDADPFITDKELAAKNRRAWNGWFCGGLSNEVRDERARSIGLSAADLGPLSDAERKAIERNFKARTQNNVKLPSAIETIDFGKVIFTNYICFEKFVFEPHSTFCYSRFNCIPNFTSTLFNDETIFSYARFNSDAFFRSAVFGGVAKIFHTVFGGTAFFHGSQFADMVFFSYSKFHNSAEFSSTVFKNLVTFGGTKFQSFASFNSSCFCEDAVFKEVAFEGDVDFGWFDELDGNRAVFPTRFLGEVNFNSARLQSKTCFTDVKFLAHVPEFHAVSFYDDTMFTLPYDYRDNWPPVKGKGVMGASEQKRAYNRLRLFMNKSLQIEEEQFFHRQEMRCKAVMANWYSKPMYWLFAAFSDFGNSVMRPVAWLGLSILAGMLFMLWMQGEFTFTPQSAVGFDWSLGLLGAEDVWVKPREAVGWSLSNSVPFLGFSKLYYGGDFADGLTWPLRVIGGVQTLLGYVLLFFLGLGLRNRFRLR